MTTAIFQMQESIYQLVKLKYDNQHSAHLWDALNPEIHIPDLELVS